MVSKTARFFVGGGLCPPIGIAGRSRLLQSGSLGFLQEEFLTALGEGAACAREGNGAERDAVERPTFHQPTHDLRRRRPRPSQQTPLLRDQPWASLGLGERVGLDLVEHFELGQLLGDERLAVALDDDLGCLLDSAEVLVVGKQCFLGIILPLKAGDRGDHLDGQPAFLVEIEREVLAVGTGDLDAGGRLVADLFFTGRRRT